MVALPTYKNDERRSRTLHEMDTYMERWPHVGKVRKIFTCVMKDVLYNHVETVMWHANGSTVNLPKKQSTK